MHADLLTHDFSLFFPLALTELDLARGKNAIELGAREELVPVLQKLKAAVEAGELDAQIEAVSGAMRSRFVK